MSIKTKLDSFDQTWFVTFTCFKWLPLFDIIDAYDLVYNWLQLIKDKGQAETLGFVISLLRAVRTTLNPEGFK